jgi:hypothetical protein
VILNAALPLLVSVTVFATVVILSSVPAKVRLVGDKLTAGAPADELNVAVTD